VRRLCTRLLFLVGSAVQLCGIGWLIHHFDATFTVAGGGLILAAGFGIWNAARELDLRTAAHSRTRDQSAR
jgi:hypothetical protein